jgi:hypothetical protein
MDGIGFIDPDPEANTQDRYRIRASADPGALTSCANADCIEQLGKGELGGYLGALLPASMRGVNQALGHSTGPYLRTRRTALTRTSKTYYGPRSRSLA